MSKIENIPQDLPEIDVEKSTSIKKVIEFLDKHLPAFPAVFKERTLSKKITGEDLISQELYEYLQNRTYKDGIFMFQFQRKSFKSSYSSDLSVIMVGNLYQLSHAFFLIEAKRLPTPKKDKKGNSREREYVSSDAGGMQRYKKGFHGADLSDSAFAMIGYIQKESCNHWHQKINDWITDLINTNKSLDITWNTDDLLVSEKDFTNTKKYNSQNTRIVNSNKDSIRIHHYLMELT
jgi:hypothetical protein